MKKEELVEKISSGNSMLHDRKIHPRQEAHQVLDRGKKLPYDCRVSERLKRLRREIEESKRRVRFYNNPVSTDNSL